MATLTRATALVVFVAGLAAVPSAFAQSQADFDACHQMAATKVQGTLSASPSSDSSTSSSARGGSGGASSSTSVSGTTSASASTTASVSGRDALQNDPTYQQAFRDCLKARGF